MLLVAILAILSDEGSLLGMGAFRLAPLQDPQRAPGHSTSSSHRQTPPSACCSAQLDVEAFEALLQQWMAAQLGVTDTADTLVCDGKTLRGSIADYASGTARFIAQVSHYSNTLGLAIAQSTYPTDAGGEISALRQLLDRVELECLFVQADALHANPGFPLPRAAWSQLPDCGET